MPTDSVPARSLPLQKRGSHVGCAPPLYQPARAPRPSGGEYARAACGRAHWADHCASCHANDGSGDTFMGRHTYPPAPDMRLPATQRMTDGELFYIIQNGIRLTAMPAWGGGGDQDALDSGKLVRFIRHLPNLTGEEKAQMEKMNPKSPAELKEEEKEERISERRRFR